MQQAKAFYLNISGVELEYLKICKQNTLQEITNGEDHANAIALVACYVGETRLIDNMMIS